VVDVPPVPGEDAAGTACSTVAKAVALPTSNSDDPPLLSELLPPPQADSTAVPATARTEASRLSHEKRTKRSTPNSSG
jgi:hypothetical protein